MPPTTKYPPVKTAVIPAAGLGTRFLPASKVIPKEMLPIFDTPTIQLIVQEAIDSGIEKIVLVTARHKEAIENHFDFHPELDESLKSKGKTELLGISQEMVGRCKIVAVRQLRPLGLGHAVLQARPIVGREPFAVLLGDDLMFTQNGSSPVTKQLIDQFANTGTSCVGVMEVSDGDIPKYGIIDSQGLVSPRLWAVRNVVEKPSASSAPSRLAIPGRYVLAPEIFDHLENVLPSVGGEIQLTDGLTNMAREQGLHAFEFHGTRYDAGDRLGYLEATIAFALSRPHYRNDVVQILRRQLSEIA